MGKRYEANEMMVGVREMSEGWRSRLMKRSRAITLFTLGVNAGCRVKQYPDYIEQPTANLRL